MHGQVIEVLVMWDANPLRVAHLTSGHGFSVGDAPIITPAGALVIPQDATGWFESPSKPRCSLAEWAAGSEIALPRGARAHMDLPTGVAFDVTAFDVDKTPVASTLATLESEVPFSHGMSFLLHAGLLGSLAVLMPAMSIDDTETIDRDRILMMQHLLESTDGSPQMAAADFAGDDTASANQTPGAPSRGNPSASKTNQRYAVAGPQDNPDPHLARLAALRDAADFGIVGLVGANAGDPNAPVAPWGREDVLGNDPTSARGNMWGDAIGDSFGLDGLGLTGVGECGCGTGVGINIGGIGTIGHGSGVVGGQGFVSSRLGGTHDTRAPVIRCGGTPTTDGCATTVNGRLPPEVVQRVVRQNFGRFRLCYEEGLRKSPSLEGRVAVKFVIARDGSVTTSQDAGSDLADEGVRQCVVRSFGTLSFPQPEGGIVMVTYPIVLSPGS